MEERNALFEDVDFTSVLKLFKGVDLLIDTVESLMILTLDQQEGYLSDSLYCTWVKKKKGNVRYILW